MADKKGKSENTVFCSECSAKVKVDARYCWNCQCDQTRARPSSPSSSLFSQAEAASSFSFGRPQSTAGQDNKRRIVSLSDYIKAKSSRECSSKEFRPKKKKKYQNQDVTINIGIKTFVDGSLKTVRGKRLPIRVLKSATCKEVLSEGVEKWKKFDRCFDSSKSYSLVYEDGSNAQFLPGRTKDFFELEQYRHEYGKDYKNIVLYLCETDDLLQYENTFSSESGHAIAQKNEVASPSRSITSEVFGKRESDNRGCSTSSTTTTTCQMLEESVNADQPEPVSYTYGNYVELFDDEWEEDNKELAAAIEASIEDQNSCGKLSSDSGNEQVLPIGDVIGDYIATNMQATSDEESINILINRKEVLTTTLRAIQRKKFSFVKPVRVTFSGEDAVDNGGPKREYFRLLMLAIQSTSMGVFKGKWFSHDLELLSTKKYEISGKLIAWSILQGGPGPKCLAKEPFLILKGHSVSYDKAIAAVGDEELKEVIKDLHSSSTPDDFNNIIQSKSDVISRYGYSKIYMCGITKKDEIILALLKQAFVFSVYAEMAQFWDGMNTIGKFGDLVKSSQNLIEVLLCENQTKLNFAAFRSLYDINFSPEGSNRRNLEEKTIYCFEAFLQDLEEGQVPNLCLEDLFIFATGADAVPPLGFDHKISIEFYEQEENVKRFPWSSTCSLSLYLPRGFNDSEEFGSLMSQALLNSQGFGKC